MVYVALLRGINVGGKTRVEMSRLKALFVSLGCGEVVTYINSGNVIFSDDRSANKLTPLIETAIEKEFKLPVRVVLRDRDNIARLAGEIPSDWTNDAEQKTDVLFLWSEIDDKSILDKVIIRPHIENVRYIDGALVWNTSRQNATRSSLLRLAGTDLYKQVTIRNINTVRKLDGLMNDRN